jgi:acyl carrier protein
MHDPARVLFRPLAHDHTDHQPMLGVEGHLIPAIPLTAVGGVAGIAVFLRLGNEAPLLIELDLLGLRGKKPRTRRGTAGAEAVRRAVAEEHEVELHAFVLLKFGGMPKTSSGKIRRHACRGAFLAGTLEACGEWRASSQPSGGGLTRAAVLTVPPHQRQALLETHFRGQLGRVLRLDPAAVDPHQPVNTLGLDSLTTLELKNALAESLGVYLPVTRFLRGASLATLASQVLTELSQQAPVPQGMSSLLRQVQQLSDDQVKALLDVNRVVS